MLTPKLFGHSRFMLFSILAGIWLVVVGLLLASNFQREQAEAYSRLEYKAEASAVQFERHWPALSHESLIDKIDYLRHLGGSFQPRLHFTVINANGRIEASTLSNLNQLSYSPVLLQLKAGLELGQHCLKTLSGLQMNSVRACVFVPPNLNSYFISSLHQDSFLYYWFEHSGYFILAVILGLLVFSVLYYLLSLQQQSSLDKQVLITRHYERKDDDLKRLISNLPGLVYRQRLDNKKLDFVSPGSLQLLGYSPEHFIQNDITPFDMIDPEDEAEFKRQSSSAHFSLKPFELVYRINILNGENKWILDRGRCYRDPNGELFIEGVMLDITERELVRQQIEYLAVQDPLTELYNRYKFNDELVSAVDDSNRKHEHFAMLFIDLDRFKNINDSLGHQLGDRLLRKVASRLQSLIPAKHFLARMGGDEFVVLMRAIEDTAEIEQLAGEINRAVRKPFNIDSYQLHTSCSIGISMCPDDSTHSHILWRYADTAMYQIKNRGGDGYQFFTKQMGDLVQHRINIEHGFIPGLENCQFELCFQPQVDINNGLVIGAEALVRWHHPTLGYVSPTEFIPIAEETGFIHDLGDWIIHEALGQLARWQKAQPNMTLAINVSALQITEDFPGKMKNYLKQYNITPNTLELEITETLLMENIDFVQPLLSEICDLGIYFAIDDFGTGYSSLSYLRYLPINKLKIDRAFVMNLEDNKEDVAMVKAIISMAKNLNLKVLAEGIETLPQLTILQDQGCDSYQGYYFNRPIDKETFYSLYMEDSQVVQSEAP